MDWIKDLFGPECNDNIPVFSNVGRGIKGDAFFVKVSDPDGACQTYLEGMSYDEATKEWTTEWRSENINGGCLSYQYKLRPYTVPQTFTITFIYRRPGRPEWSWTTPAIPYLWSVGDDGNKQPGDPDAVVGSGVATLYLKKTTEEEWHEKLVYPEGTGPEDFNTPDPLKAWTVNLELGIGGDIDIPNIDDLAKVLGITVEQINNIIKGTPGAIDGSDNIKDYVDDKDKGVLDHVHEDLGFDGGFLPGDGGETSVKKYIDDIKGEIDKGVEANLTYVKNALADILDKIYGGGTIGADGHITWPNTSKIPVADLNVFSGSSPSNSTYADAIRSRALSDDDVRTQ